MTEINISRRGEMSIEEALTDLQVENDELTEEISQLENQVSEQTKRAEEAEDKLEKTKTALAEIDAVRVYCLNRIGVI